MIVLKKKGVGALFDECGSRHMDDVHEMIISTIFGSPLQRSERCFIFIPSLSSRSNCVKFVGWCCCPEVRPRFYRKMQECLAFRMRSSQCLVALLWLVPNEYPAACLGYESAVTSLASNVQLLKVTAPMKHALRSHRPTLVS